MAELLYESINISINKMKKKKKRKELKRRVDQAGRRTHHTERHTDKQTKKKLIWRAEQLFDLLEGSHLRSICGRFAVGRRSAVNLFRGILFFLFFSFIHQPQNLLISHFSCSLRKHSKLGISIKGPLRRRHQYTNS